MQTRRSQYKAWNPSIAELTDRAALDEKQSELSGQGTFSLPACSKVSKGPDLILEFMLALLQTEMATRLLRDLKLSRQRETNRGCQSQAGQRTAKSGVVICCSKVLLRTREASDGSSH